MVGDRVNVLDYFAASGSKRLVRIGGDLHFGPWQNIITDHYSLPSHQLMTMVYALGRYTEIATPATPSLYGTKAFQCQIQTSLDRRLGQKYSSTLVSESLTVTGLQSGDELVSIVIGRTCH